MNLSPNAGRLLALSLIVSATGVAGCESMTAGHDGGEEERDVAVADLPAPVTDAIRRMYPAGVIEEAEVEMEGGREVYSVEVKEAGKEHEVEVTADGTVLEIDEVTTSDPPHLAELTTTRRRALDPAAARSGRVLPS